MHDNPNSMSFEPYGPEPEAPPERPHISPSQMSMYFTCGESYRRRYILGEKIPPSAVMVRGTGVHRAAERNYRQKISARIDLPEREMIEAAVDAFDEEVKNGVELSAEETAIGKDRALGSAKDSTVRLTSVFAREIALCVQPTLVEKRIRLPMPGSHDILGVLDVVDERAFVRDLKTGSRMKTAADLDTDQMNYYAAAYEYEIGAPPERLALDVLIDTKVPKAQVISRAPHPKDPAILAARVNAMLHGLKAGSFAPAAPGSWKCSERWCGYWRTCPYVNQERRAAAEE